ncbi:hypothetical protein TNCV_819051 [Trichonephila clavipes]|nr:hypothetical protein TNCV_819051 [Trichonephila clavipes]
MQNVKGPPRNFDTGSTQDELLHWYPYRVETGDHTGLGSVEESLVYADKLQTFDHLEDNIRRVIADIRPQILENVIENWTSRLDYIRASRGSDATRLSFE